MKIAEYEKICGLDIYKNLKKDCKILFSLLDKYHCCFNYKEWFYISQDKLHELSNLSEWNISKSKKILVYFGLIQIKKHYNSNGHRGIDYIHLNSLEEIIENLQKDHFNNQKDLNRLYDLTVKID